MVATRRPDLGDLFGRHRLVTHRLKFPQTDEVFNSRITQKFLLLTCDPNPLFELPARKVSWYVVLRVQQHIGKSRQNAPCPSEAGNDGIDNKYRHVRDQYNPESKDLLSHRVENAIKVVICDVTQPPSSRCYRVRLQFKGGILHFRKLGGVITSLLVVVHAFFLLHYIYKTKNVEL
jgi:hypothetical protein